MTTITLSKPITDEGKSITSLTFREPTGNDVIDCGFPWRFETSDDGKSMRSVNTPAIGLLIARLADIPHYIPHQMSVRDFMKANSIVMGFFTAEAEPSSS